MMASDRGRTFLFVETGAWLVFATGMWIYSYRFDGDFPAYLWGPVSWPRAVLAAVVVLALAQFAMRLVTASRSGPGAETVSGEGREAWGERPGSRDGCGEAHAVSRGDRGEAGEGVHAGRSEVADDTGEARAGSREAWRNEAGGAERHEAEHGSGEAQGGWAARVRILSTFGLPFVYLALLPRTGYFATTPLFLVAYMLVFRERSLKYMLATAALLYLGSLAIFSKLLFVPLPTGNWPGFYDFSNWLLQILNAL